MGKNTFSYICAVLKTTSYVISWVICSTLSLQAVTSLSSLHITPCKITICKYYFFICNKQTRYNALIVRFKGVVRQVFLALTRARLAKLKGRWL